MTLRRFLDLSLVLSGGALGLTALLYTDGVGRWGFAALGFGIAALFLWLAIRGPSKQGTVRMAGAPISETPPRGQITEAVLLGEEGNAIASWQLYGKTSMVIGRDVGENQVDINLSGSTSAATIDVEHAALNYTGGKWYVEDLGSQNGVRIQKHADGRRYSLAPDKPCDLEPGDIVYIGLARLLLR